MLLNHWFSFDLNSDNTQNDANTKEFWVNMPNLMTHLKKVSEQKPQATYYNVDMLKYQVILSHGQGDHVSHYQVPFQSAYYCIKGTFLLILLKCCGYKKKNNWKLKEPCGD